MHPKSEWTERRPHIWIWYRTRGVWREERNSLTSFVCRLSDNSTRIINSSSSREGRRTSSRLVRDICDVVVVHCDLCFMSTNESVREREWNKVLLQRSSSVTCAKKETWWLTRMWRDRDTMSPAKPPLRLSSVWGEQVEIQEEGGRDKTKELYIGTAVK